MLRFRSQKAYNERSEGEASRCPSRETLRGVYPERQRRAQGDKALPMLVVKVHYRGYLSPRQGSLETVV